MIPIKYNGICNTISFLLPGIFQYQLKLVFSFNDISIPFNGCIVKEYQGNKNPPGTTMKTVILCRAGLLCVFYL